MSGTGSEVPAVRGLWTSRVAFILAATGSAVGLGNIWRFPYVTGENGGGAFVFIYIACVFLIGIPIMMAEVMLGRRAQRNPIDTMRDLAIQEQQSARWAWVGRMGIAAGFLILSYYSVVAGWILAYIPRMLGSVFHGMDAIEVESVFTALISDPERLIAWHTIFMVATVAIVARGVEHGLEKAVRYMMPALFGILVVLFLYVLTLDSFVDGLKFMFIPDFSKFRGESILAAMGMAFFSLSLGMGAIMMYGSYLPKGASIARTTIVVAMSDTVVALMAGLVIFPIVFANNMEPAQGAGLVFTTLPLAFNSLPMGALIGTLFFVLLAFAAITSAISLLEPPVAWLVENKHWDRAQAARLCGGVVWLLGLGTVFSFNLWADYKWTQKLDLGKVQFLLWENKTFFNIVEFLTANVMLPLGGLLIALFAAHLMKRESCEDELALDNHHFNLWYFILRFIAPVAVVIIFLHTIGVFNMLGLID
ncbi:MAG: sodium-dependent transporter [Gammaproteobacteria bacterium]|nr:sodium-dependent transporter [Gammaproteobacteria bacterium]